MLAGLEERSLIAREAPAAADAASARLTAENQVLRQALRQSRQTIQRSVTLNARKGVAQTSEISRLQCLLDAASERVAAFGSGQAIVESGQRLMALSEANAQLAETARRVWLPDQTLGAAHDECAGLACERERAINCLETNARLHLTHHD
jgi:hypothetical protein